MYKINYLLALVIGVVAWAAMGVSSLEAQGNRIPLNWRKLTVKVIETYGNNNTKPLRGAKVTIDVTEDYRAVLDSLQKLYPVLRMPVTRTAQTRGASFNKLPPSRVLGPYVVTVDPKPNDRKNEYTCTEKTARATREVRMGGGSPQRLNFNFKCLKTDIENEFKRRRKGGYDLTVKLEQNGGTRGNGYWVYLYDKDDKRIKKVRSSGRGEAKFRAIDPALNTYKVEVYRMNKLINTSTYDMPEENSTHTVDLNN